MGYSNIYSNSKRISEINDINFHESLNNSRNLRGFELAVMDSFQHFLLIFDEYIEIVILFIYHTDYIYSHVVCARLLFC